MGSRHFTQQGIILAPPQAVKAPFLEEASRLDRGENQNPSFGVESISSPEIDLSNLQRDPRNRDYSGDRL
jgi:hypothetical protein